MNDCKILNETTLPVDELNSADQMERGNIPKPEAEQVRHKTCMRELTEEVEAGSVDAEAAESGFARAEEEVEEEGKPVEGAEDSLTTAESFGEDILNLIDSLTTEESFVQGGDLVNLIEDLNYLNLQSSTTETLQILIALQYTYSVEAHRYANQQIQSLKEIVQSLKETVRPLKERYQHFKGMLVRIMQHNGIAVPAKFLNKKVTLIESSVRGYLHSVKEDIQCWNDMVVYALQQRGIAVPAIVLDKKNTTSTQSESSGYGRDLKSHVQCSEALVAYMMEKAGMDDPADSLE